MVVLYQFDFPLAMTTVLGPGGLNQTGLSLEWLMPSLLAHANLLTVQVTNGESGHLFSGGFFSIPSALVHLKSYYDLTESAYLELGLTGMLGFNHHEGKEVATDAGSTVVDEERRETWLGGVDLTVSWEPLRQAKYAEVTWRSELYYAHKDQAARAVANPDGAPVEGLGAYSYLHVRFDDNWEVGVRGDFTQPFRIDPGSDHTWQVMPYVNWWQSHWVRLRLHYSHLDGTLMDRADDRLLLQATWAVGPHKHERY